MTEKDRKILYCYYIIEAIIFLLVKIFEQVFPGSRVLDITRYSAIVCNFFMIAYIYMKYGRELGNRDNLICLAFALTLVADTFMCVISGQRTMGYLFFVLVETVYMIYMKPTYRSVLIRLGLYIAVLLLLWRSRDLNISNALAMANMVQLTVNVFCAWIRRNRDKCRENLLFAWGITLFFGCDFSIVIRTVVETSPIHDIAAFIVWTCYIPAQVLLLSSYAAGIKRGDTV